MATLSPQNQSNSNKIDVECFRKRFNETIGVENNHETLETQNGVMQNIEQWRDGTKMI